MTDSLSLRDRLLAGVAAGLVSGITLAAFAAFAQLRSGQSVASTYTFLAEAAAGPGIAGSAGEVALGVAVLFASAIVWAVGYSYAALHQPQLLTRPVLSGLVFGIVVWFVSQLLLVAAQRFTEPTLATFDRDMVAFPLFFGIPLAYVAARFLRAR